MEFNHKFVPEVRTEKPIELDVSLDLFICVAKCINPILPPRYLFLHFH